jgi:glycosyltransferase involved in cell wall biosynthesis
LTVPSADADALCAAIKRLFNGTAQRQEMSAMSRRIAAKEYSLEVQAQRYSELYKSLI